MYGWVTKSVLSLPSLSRFLRDFFAGGRYSLQETCGVAIPPIDRNVCRLYCPKRIPASNAAKIQACTPCCWFVGAEKSFVMITVITRKNCQKSCTGAMVDALPIMVSDANSTDNCCAIVQSVNMQVGHERWINAPLMQSAQTVPNLKLNMQSGNKLLKAYYTDKRV